MRGKVAVSLGPIRRQKFKTGHAVPLSVPAVHVNWLVVVTHNTIQPAGRNYRQYSDMVDDGDLSADDPAVDFDKVDDVFVPVEL